MPNFANAYGSKMQDTAFLEKNSLLLANISKRVCKDARNDKRFPPTIRKIISQRGLSNLELFISLLEKNQVSSTEEAVRRLKKMLERDIQKRLRASQHAYYLHKALFEFHTIARHERLTGLITLNYDRVVDDAYETVLRRKPNYGFSLNTADSDDVPLLKLHGGFGLTYRDDKLPIITPGVNKNYLELPYNFVWGRAHELLLECDVLRVIGCSLSQNDMGIVDLLFKAQLRRRKEHLLLQIIDFDPPNNRVNEQFGFFPRIETAKQIEGELISDVTIGDSTTGSNPFKIWLKAKIERTMKTRDIEKTDYIKRILE